MSWNGKILGAILGFMVGGPVGLLAGIIIGHLFDVGYFDAGLAKLGIYRRTGRQSNIRKVFFNATFMIMGYVAKSDGRVSENEIRTARKVMADMGLNSAMQQEAIRLFNIGKQPNFNLSATINELRLACAFHHNLLQAFIEIQLQMAQADGVLSATKRAALETIIRQLGVYGFSFDNFDRQSRTQQNYRRYSKLDDAYANLGVNTKATNAEIKKAYRRLMSKHHPDKLIAEGVPKEMLKMATQKTQQIKKAYEIIKKDRGM